MKALFYSIKWQLLIICSCLVIVPTVLMGAQAYSTFQKQTYANTEKNLKSIAKDWQVTTRAYVLEEDRILKREESLYEKRLGSVALDGQSLLELGLDQYGANPPAAKLQAVLQKISDIKVGQSGSVIVFNSRGDILVVDNKVVGGQHFANSSNSSFFSDSIAKITALKDNDTLSLTYPWSNGEGEASRQKLGVFAYYKPLDLVIGANSYVTDFKSQDLDEKLKGELKDLMAAQKIGENGYIWVVDSLGNYVVSKDEYRNGENIAGIKDKQGRPIVRDIINRTKQLSATDPYIQYYLWRNIGETQDSQVVSASVYVADWDWIIGVSAYKADFLKGLHVIKNQVLLTVVAMLSVGLGVAYLFASWIARPVKKLESIATKVAGGQLGQDIDADLAAKQGEVGNLARAFHMMVSKLREKISEITVEKSNVEQQAKELTAAKAKDEAILNSIGEGLIVTDSSGFILLINTVAADLLGIDNTRNFSFGRRITDYNLYDEHGHFLLATDRPVTKALATSQKVTQVVQSSKADGGRYTLLATATPVIERNQTIGAIQIIRDITKEREVDRMKTEFISIASHQLRTPLSAIKWFGEMLLSGDAGKLQPDQEEFVSNMASSTERMIELVNSLLNISRLESGRLMIDPKPTDLKDLVSGIVNDLKGKTAEKQQSLIISVHKDLPKINLDPRLIGQVYLNLLTNAIKYTPKGGEISVFVSRKGNDIVSQVTDNGYGIPKTEQSKVFQKFFRATNIIKVETDGTGLGMYLIKSIIESSGGKIWFKSDEGKGTTFWFSLPMQGMAKREGEVTLD